MNDQRGTQSDPPPDDAAYDDAPDGSSRVFRFEPGEVPAPFDEAGIERGRSLFDEVPDFDPDDSSIFGAGAGDVFSDLGLSDDASPFAPGQGAPASGDPGSDRGQDGPAFRFDDISGEPTGSLPHWTEPSTGVLDVGAIRDHENAAPRTAEDERLDAWASLDDPGPVWSEGEREARNTGRVGSTGSISVGGWDEPDPQDVPFRPGSGGDRDLSVAMISGVVLGGGVLALLVLAPVAVLVVLVAALATLAVGEVYTTFRRSGMRPAHVLGLVATAGLVLGSYWKGVIAIPVLFSLFVIVSMAHYLVEPVERPLSGWSLTLSAVMWIGLPAALGALLLAGPHGRGAFAVAVVGAVASDIGGYAFGRSIGRSRLNPEVSPNKTWEGLFGGAAMCVIVLLGLSVFASFEPIDGVLDALVVGIVVAVVVPVGDLCQSLIKRDLGVKDMGTMIPGHGGLTDRFDGLLFSLIATWLVLLALNLAPVGATL